MLLHLITAQAGGAVELLKYQGPEMSCVCGFEVPVGRSVLKSACPVGRHENQAKPSHAPAQLWGVRVRVRSPSQVVTEVFI